MYMYMYMCVYIYIYIYCEATGQYRTKYVPFPVNMINQFELDLLNVTTSSVVNFDLYVFIKQKQQLKLI